MSLAESSKEFEQRMLAMYPGSAKSGAFGASNAPFVMDGGFRFGLFNIDGVRADEFAGEGKALVLMTRVVLPERNALYLALAFKGDALKALGRRRDEIKADKGNASKVRVYMHKTGVYLAQDTDDEVLNPGTLGAAQVPTAAYFADMDHETSLAPVETAYVAYLAGLLAPTALQRVGPDGVTGGAAVVPSSVQLGDVMTSIAKLGAVYVPALVERYHAGLNFLPRKHFVLLTGISGTGKTLLARAYAFAVSGAASLELDLDNFFLIPVRPDWHEPAHLLGFFDSISGTYRRTRFTDALLTATGAPHRAVFVCLDEMNLAQPEHYFSDLLSAMETGERIHLHAEAAPVSGVPPFLAWPANLYITGTVNMDETTHAFSPKVLDRATVIDMSAVDVKEFSSQLLTRNPTLGQAFGDAEVRVLSEMSAALSPHGLHFGYRVVEEVARYLNFAKSGAMQHHALDFQIEQKILTKLRGGRELEPMLTKLSQILGGYPSSKSAVERMRQSLQDYDAFQYWP